ncbi:Uncharacterised protein [Bordetella pertussis]|nr:Uncharacterised protein [Bordetella pertussis]
MPPRLAASGWLTGLETEIRLDLMSASTSPTIW